jgi:septal ring factor EnvC (AmiA/AmiB activator)
MRHPTRQHADPVPNDDELASRLRALDAEIERLRKLVRSQNETLAHIRRENALLRRGDHPAPRLALSPEEVAFAMRQAMEAA